MSLILHSQDFVPHGVMHPKFTCEGANISPSLNWGNVPDGVQSFALICDDPDAPRGTWVHWVYYDIPANVLGLPQRVEKDAQLPDGSRQGRNDFGQIGYNGPCPPPGHGEHHYSFRLYALDSLLKLPPGATKAELLAAMEGHLLDQGEVVVRFERRTQR